MNINEFEAYLNLTFPNGGINTYLGNETICGVVFEKFKNEYVDTIMVYYRRDTGEKIKVFGNKENFFIRYDFFLEDEIKQKIIKERLSQNDI